MIVNLDLTKPAETITDLAFLDHLLKVVVGLRCFKVDMSYGDELMLHIGDPAPYHNGKLADEKKGSWILGTRASSWRLLLSHPPKVIESGPFPNAPSVPPLWRAPDYPLQPITGEEIEHATRQLADKTVLAIRHVEFPLPTPIGAGVGLVVGFEGGHNLVVMPSPEPDLSEDRVDTVADWELFTPFHMYLRVGPGLVGSYLRSDSLEKTAS